MSFDHGEALLGAQVEDPDEFVIAAGHNVMFVQKIETRDRRIMTLQCKQALTRGEIQNMQGLVCASIINTAIPYLYRSD